LPALTGDYTITAQWQRQSPRPRNPKHSAQVKAGHGDPFVTLTLLFERRQFAPAAGDRDRHKARSHVSVLALRDLPALSDDATETTGLG
jgi:hypothetical protein